MKKQSQIYSIFGQIEEAAASSMIAEGKGNKIEADMIPPTARYNERGERAKFAIVLHSAHVAEFENRIANLRA